MKRTRQRADLAFAPGDAQHLLGCVDADDLAAVAKVLGQRERCFPEAAADVEQSITMCQAEPVPFPRPSRRVASQPAVPSMVAISTFTFGSSSTPWYPSPCVSSVAMAKGYDVVFAVAVAPPRGNSEPGHQGSTPKALSNRPSTDRGPPPARWSMTARWS